MSRRDRDYHVERARAELDLAQDARSPEAAHAHIQLSGLHMARVRRMDDGVHARAR